MKLRISTKGAQLVGPVREALERRLRLTLARHGPSISVAYIQLEDGEETTPRCRASLRLRDGSRVSFEERAADVRSAAELLAWRLDHRLSRRRFRRPISHAHPRDARDGDALSGLPTPTVTESRKERPGPSGTTDERRTE